MMKKALSYFLFIIAMYCNSNAKASEVVLFTDENINKQIQKQVEDKIAQQKTAGMVVLVQKDGEVAYLNSFGYKRLKDKNKRIREPEPMELDTIFDLASLTKVLATTQAIMMLDYEGKINLSDKASKYLEEFKNTDKEDITIYDLLTHSSGFTPWRPLYYYASNKDEVLDYIVSLPLSYKTGTSQIYSDFSFIILGMVVEKITNQPLDEYLTKNLYEKLEMKDTGYNLSEDKKQRSASTSWQNLYEQEMISSGRYNVKSNPKKFNSWRDYTLKGEVDDGNTYHAMKGVSGHAGLFSTAFDVSKLMQLMLNGGTYNGSVFYSQKIMDEFSSKQIKLGNNARAIGFDYSRSYMGENRPDGTFGHIGFSGTCLALNKEQNIGIIILSNRQNVGLNKDRGYTGFKDLCADIMDSVYENYSK